jgi:asparaginyl-tRNA synthetase
MGTRQMIKTVLHEAPINGTRRVCGWVRTKRESKALCFLEINDGSCFSGLQVVLDRARSTFEEIIPRIQTGASLDITGVVQASPGQEQAVELHAEEVVVVGEAPPDSYPLQKKRHSFEYLREIAHLRPRTNTFGAVTRVRNALSMAIHAFFQKEGFFWIHTPIITASDSEGAGRMFRVTTLEPGETEQYPDSDFFGKPAYLTVSGQLNAEIYACAMDRVYTFGPTFRAENSNTTRHLAEFWMIEPEAAFFDITDNMDLAENFLQSVFRTVLSECEQDMAFFEKRIQPGVIRTVQNVIETRFTRMSYTEAIEALQNSGRSFEFPVEWGIDLQSEHERFLTEDLYKGPVIVTDYPKDIKAFYMKLNEDDKTVRAMDVLVPRIGEIIGGSQREEDLETLSRRIRENGLDEDAYWWYLELRRFGTVPHSGFGLGFERLVQYVTGMQNIRDVIPFPRTVRNAEF